MIVVVCFALKYSLKGLFFLHFSTSTGRLKNGESYQKDNLTFDKLKLQVQISLSHPGPVSVFKNSALLFFHPRHFYYTDNKFNHFLRV